MIIRVLLILVVAVATLVNLGCRDDPVVVLSSIYDTGINSTNQIDSQNNESRGSSDGSSDNGLETTEGGSADGGTEETNGEVSSDVSSNESLEDVPGNDVSDFCTSDRDCPTGNSCDVVVGECGPTSCMTTEGCPVGYSCDLVAAVCVPPTCTNDNDCIPGHSCPNGFCVQAEVGVCRCGDPHCLTNLATTEEEGCIACEANDDCLPRRCRQCNLTENSPTRGFCEDKNNPNCD